MNDAAQRACYFDLVMRATPNSILLINKDGLIEYCSATLLDVIGVENFEQLRGKPFQELYRLFDDSSLIEEAEKQFWELNGGSVVSMQVSITFPMVGEPRMYYLQVIPLIDEAGAFAGAQALLQDVTDALHSHAEKSTRVMLDATPLACTLWNGTGEMLDCNLAAPRMFGLKDQKELKQRWRELRRSTSPDDNEIFDDRMHKALETGQSDEFDWTFQTADGESVPVHISLVCVPWKDEKRLAMYGRDLRVLHETQDDFSRMSMIVQTSPQFVLYLGESGEVEYMNPAGSVVTGYSVDEMKVHGLPLIFAPEDIRKFNEEYLPEVKKNGNISIELYMMQKNGELRNLMASLALIRLHDDRFGFGFSARDITELKRMQRDLILAKEQAERRGEITLSLLSMASEYRDHETGMHEDRSTNYARVLVEDLMKNPQEGYELTDRQAEDIIAVTRLHDIGKIAIPDNILLKPAKLTDDEFEVIKTHAARGAEMLQSSLNKLPGDECMKTAYDIANGHHERWDGGGYPNGVSDYNIPLSARIAAIADVFDALTTKRPYKGAMTPKEAFDILIEGSGTKFDPYLIDIVKRQKSAFEAIL